ncbi:MAG TPA: hypothetical protein VFK78_11745 [Gemmatimonadales bacterium]|nr:hypothetical protein [Gemmatimonadales bacterium]
MTRWLTVAAVLVLAGGCSDALEQNSSAGQFVVVVDSTPNTLTLISTTDFGAQVLDLRTPTGTPGTLAGRGSRLVVPLGQADAAASVDLAVRTDTVSRVVPVAAGSGATGAAFSADSIAWLANPGLNTVTRVVLTTGDTTSLAAGRFPQALAVASGHLFIANGNLVAGNPAGPSWLTAYDLANTATADSIPLSCTNAKHIAVGDDGLLYVVCAGTAGQADGKLSIVDPATRKELVLLNGLGESPGAAVYHPSGRLLVASAQNGILEVNALTRSVTRGPGSGVKPGGDGVSGLAVDQAGRVYAVDRGDCSGAGSVRALSAPPDYSTLKTVTVGVCPVAAAVAVVPPRP